MRLNINCVAMVTAKVREERPLDPTGTVMYMDQCEAQGRLSWLPHTVLYVTRSISVL